MNIIQKPSKNYNSRGAWAPNVIVNHITGGTKVSSAINEFMVNDRASAHFIIDLDGTVYQCVDIRQAAWGNGTTTKPGSNPYSGDSKLDIVRRRKVNANLYTVSIEHVNAGGGLLTPAQLAASIELHRYIIAEVKRIYGIDIPIDREHITGHCFIAPKTKPSCPGAQFPYETIIAGIKGELKVKSDTTCDMTMRVGAEYTVKLTADFKPECIAGSSGIVRISNEGNSGKDYFYRITTLKPGTTGIYTTNKKKLFIVTVK